MKRFIVCALITLIFYMSFLFSGCGEKAGDLFVAFCTEEHEAFGDPGIGRYYVLGVQRNNGELIRLLAVKDRGFDVLVQREGNEADLVLDDVSLSDIVGGFVDHDGSYILYGKHEIADYKPDGTDSACFSVSQTIRQIVPGEQGKYYSLASDSEAECIYAVDFKRETLDKLPVKMSSNEINLGYLYFGNNRPHLVGRFGVYLLDVKNGTNKKVFDFEGSAYSFAINKSPIVSIEYLDEDKITIYRYNGHADTIEYVNVSMEREIIELRTGRFQYGSLYDYLKAAVGKYNAESKKYYVVMDSFDDESMQFDSYSKKTNSLVAAGEIDLLMMNAIDTESGKILNSGKLLDLREALTERGVDPDSYYPIVFNPYGREDDAVFGVSITVWGSSCAIDSEAAAYIKNGDFSIGGFLSCVESANGGMMLLGAPDRAAQTTLFLSCSSSLCGSINWEEETCEFNNELFRQVTYTIKTCPINDDYRYAYTFSPIYDASSYVSSKEAIKYDGLVVIDGIFYDDGLYPSYQDGDEFVIPVNSRHIAGAVDFLSFLLGDKAQRMLPDYGCGIGNRAIDREYVDKLVGLEVLHATINPTLQMEGNRVLSTGDTEAYADWISDNKDVLLRNIIIDNVSMEEYIQMKERMRSVPRTTHNLLAMVYEELPAYYEDKKTFEEVCEILNDRVGTYLKEHAE